jgi:NAD(P)-dependent dehydrogenase (short-subunit alcohol dehydrogenase family)
MTLYRATPKDGVAWITGASTGIGRALALDLAREGYVVAVTARDEDNLTTLVAEAAGLPGRIIPFACDVTDEAGMERTVAAVEREAGPLALAVFNAGNYFPTRPQRLEALNFSKTFEVNVMGVIYGLVPALDRMKERGRGHLVIVGSVTAYFGWPATAAYGSSKAALFNLAEGLKYDLDKMNVRIQVMNPGFIDTPLTRKNSFAMPALMPVDKASQRIAHGLRSGGFEVTFPWRFTWFLKFLRILPQPLRFAFINRATGWRKR